MLPGTEKRKPRNSSKVNLFFSLTFHGMIVLSVFYFAAREGYLGKPLAKIAVQMIPEKKPDKPKEPDKAPEKPPVVETPKVVDVPKPEASKPAAQAPPPAASESLPAIAPPPAEAAPFYFPGGAVVESSSDPVEVYKGLLQNSLQSRWDRPVDLDDQSLVAEVDVAVDRTGQIGDPVWKKNSGQKRWDDSVSQAIARTQSVSRPPPSNFPSRVVVRFDVVPSEPIAP